MELTSNFADEVIVVYGDPRRKKEDGYWFLQPGAVKRIATTRSQFLFQVFDETDQVNLLYTSPIITDQNCPKVTTKTPRITGTKRVGQQLTAATPGWAPLDVQLSYQWYRSGKKIVGATAATYILTASDKGRKISVGVTGAHDGYFSVTKVSKKTAKVKAGILAPAPRPSISGVAVVGTTLTAEPGVWGPVGVTLSYQWYRGGKKIGKATSPTYLLGTGDLNRKISVKVTGKLAGFTTVGKTSIPTLKVTATL